MLIWGGERGNKRGGYIAAKLKKHRLNAVLAANITTAQKKTRGWMLPAQHKASIGPCIGKFYSRTLPNQG
jgi:hypothetical protein